MERGLSVQPWIKTSLSPGSGVVSHYLEDSGVLPYLQRLGFDVVGYGCMTCIGNSGPLPEPVSDAIEKVGRGGGGATLVGIRHYVEKGEARQDRQGEVDSLNKPER